MRVRIIVTGFLCLIHSSVIYAAYDAADLQKLFTDKRQRAQIDSARSGNYSPSVKKPQTRQIKVSGYVTRSDGKSVVWVNNKNTLNSTKMGGVRVHQSSIGRNKKVTVTVDGAAVRLKPGETWSENSGITDITD
ncbi:MAG: hypothetical protein KAJ32_10895 [Gammaproteobacteria bacterium]|nr:hypothetical protein [Gammaproteobacteria bacterium]